MPLKILSLDAKFPIHKIAGWEDTVRAREDYGDLDELVEDIKKRGVIQPILLSQDHRLITGGRRYRATKRLRRKTIPAMTVEVSGDIDMAEIELIENRRRKDLHWWEEAKLEAKLHDHYMATQPDWSQKETARVLGSSKSQISRKIQLAGYLDAVPELKTFDTPHEASTAIEHIIRNRLAEKAANKALAESVNANVDQNTEAEREENAEGPPPASDGPPEEAKQRKIGKYAGLIPTAFMVGDAFEGMRTFQEGEFHCAEVDPPYGIALHEKREQTGDQESMNRYNEVAPDDYADFLNRTAKEVYRLLAEDSFCIWWFGIEWYETVRTVLTKTKFRMNPVPCIWYKGTKGVTTAAYYNLANTYETFFLIRKGAPKLRKQGRPNLFHHAPPAGKERTHATQKPVELYKELYDLVCPDSGKVLVPFAGSGAALFGAYLTDRIAYGWDLDSVNKNLFLRKWIDLSRVGRASVPNGEDE